VNGKKLSPVELLSELNRIGARHAIGQVDMVKTGWGHQIARRLRDTGRNAPVRGAPRNSKSGSGPRNLHCKEMLAIRYAELVYNGQWFSALRAALDAFVNVTQRSVTGTSRLKLYKGNARPRLKGRRIIVYSGPGIIYRHGFLRPEGRDRVIKLFGLPMKVAGLVDRKKRP